ncbi:HVO_2922 family protein [Halorubrum salsamenti]|uniref:HVO_2922 family protein n=1 Tax=Halorubrum salsamenti TaxID=2583990 RepID=UPI0011AA3AB8|nr:HVO_2922 family protein [Halorubrum salsamenti]
MENADHDPSGGLYERRIGTPTTDDEVNGFWLFGFGVLLGLAGVVLFSLTESATTTRGIAYALAALAPPFVMLGAVIRFPLRRAGTFIGYLGTTVSVLGVVWFVNIFPDGWFTASGDPAVIAVYGVGLVLIGLAGTVVPLLSDPVREDYERMQSEAAAATTERDETSAELEATREELETARENLASTREGLESTREDLKATREELATADSELEAARAETAALRESKARFELFEDAGGKPRWRLRHRNGNVIATAGQGYSSRGKAQQGLHSVRRNALGAGILRIETPVAEAEAIADDDGPEPADAADPDVAVPSEDEEIASRGTFELFEDAGGEWRWRLRHDNGNVISDSGEGYASKSNAKRALGRVREHAAAADYLQVDPTAFEMFRDAAGEWRWRLIHENGNVLADSGEGYSSRSKARQGLDSVRSNAAEAGLEAVGDDGVSGDADGSPNATFELYEDAAEEYRWRLRHRNGNIIADSGEGYASEPNARDAIGRVREYAPDADVLEVGNAAFEIYEDAGGEWRWRLRHRNGNIVADSGQGYASRSNAVEGVTSVKRNAPGAAAETVEAGE